MYQNNYDFVGEKMRRNLAVLPLYESDQDF